MDTAVIDECTRLSFADVPFPQVVSRLDATGVVAYHADLVAMRKTYYDGGSDCHDGPLPVADAPAVAERFEEAEVVAAIRASQRGEIGYTVFLQRIMRAGCAGYGVYLRGRKAIYFGRDGGFVVEPFPEPGR